MKAGVYLTYSEFNHGNRVPIEEFRKGLSKYRRGSVLYMCSVINCIIRPWLSGNDETADKELISNSFPPELSDHLLNLLAVSSEARILFHRQQALFVAKEALLNCADEGLDPISTPYWGGLGLILLMASDHLPINFATPRPVTSRDLAALLADFIVITEYSHVHEPKGKIARSYMMLNKIPEKLRGDPRFIDISKDFKNALGLTILEFQSICFGLLTRLMKVSFEALRADPRAFLIPETYLSSTALAPGIMESALSNLAGTPDTLRDRFSERDCGNNDFTWFRDTPLIIDRGNIYCVDWEFLAEKLDAGIFWTVHNYYRDSKRQHALHTYWGLVFEQYVNDLLVSCANPFVNRVISFPKYSTSGSEVCDVLIVCGSAAILIEAKGSTFTATAKYSGDSTVLEKEIEEKLGVGVTQLKTAISTLFTRSAKDKVAGIDISNVRTIFPVIVTRDGIGDALVLNAYLNERFDLNPKVIKPKVVTPLFCMSVEVLERIASYLGDVRMIDILEAHYMRDKKLMGSFLMAGNPVMDGAGTREAKVVDDAFGEFTEHMEITLFPKEHSMRKQPQQ